MMEQEFEGMNELEVTRMVLAADYPFLDVLWTMLVFFAWVIWFWILIRVFADVFRRHDLSGWGKAGWILFTIALPFLGVLIYLIAHGQDMGQRDIEQVTRAIAGRCTHQICGRTRRGWSCITDRAGQAAARQRRDQPGRVRVAEGEGARRRAGHGIGCRPCGRSSSPPSSSCRCWSSRGCESAGAESASAASLEDG